METSSFLVSLDGYIISAMRSSVELQINFDGADTIQLALLIYQALRVLFELIGRLMDRKLPYRPDPAMCWYEMRKKTSASTTVSTALWLVSA